LVLKKLNGFKGIFEKEIVNDGVKVWLVKKSSNNPIRYFLAYFLEMALLQRINLYVRK